MARRPTTNGEVLAVGTNAVVALLRSGHAVRQVYVRRGEPVALVAEALRDAGMTPTVVSTGDLDRLAPGARHQGVVARAAAFPVATLDAVLTASGRGVVALDGIVDPRNLGAIVRSARAAGVRGLVVPKDRSAPMSAVAVAASAGAAFGFPVARVPNLVRALDAMKGDGRWVIGLSAEGDRPVTDVPTVEDPVLVVGGEGEGLRRLVREHCDFVARIPMAGGVESLNASVAAAVALYEIVVRRWNAV